MFKFFSKMFGIIFLALAVITAIIDLTKSIADSKVVLTAFGAQWAELHVASLQNIQVGIQRKLSIPWAWDLFFVPLLQMPTWAIFAGLTAIFLFLGRRPERRLRKRLES